MSEEEFAEIEEIFVGETKVHGPEFNVFCPGHVVDDGQTREFEMCAWDERCPVE